MKEQIINLAQLSDRLEGTDEEMRASRLHDIMTGARAIAIDAEGQLAELGVVVIDDAERDPWEPIPALECPGVDLATAGAEKRDDDRSRAWMATPAEVVDWASEAGIEIEIGGRGVEITAVFDDKPAEEIRAALKQAGFSWKRGKGWSHKAFGQYQRSIKVTAARSGGAA